MKELEEQHKRADTKSRGREDGAEWLCICIINVAIVKVKIDLECKYLFDEGGCVTCRGEN